MKKNKKDTTLWQKNRHVGLCIILALCCLLQRGYAQEKTVAEWAASDNPDALEQVAALLLDGADVNATDTNGHTALHVCAAFNRPAIAELLLLHGADINAPSKTGRTPLHRAVFTKQPEMIVFLVTNGADMGIADGYGLTPLQLGLRHNLQQEVNLLVDLGGESL